MIGPEEPKLEPNPEPEPDDIAGIDGIELWARLSVTVCPPD